MKLFLPDPEIADDEGFSKNDIFGYEDFGKGLAKLLAQVEDPLVMALDGPWGSGKSIFTKMWAGHLRNEGFPVIYFDAFANDYMEDAFLALAGEVVELAADKKAKSKASFIKKAKGVGKTLAKHGANIGVKAATLNVMDSDDAKAIAGDIGKAVSELTDNALGEVLEGRKKDKKSLEDFRLALEKLVGGLQEDPDNLKPLIFIIDELDRCRPDFALDILERIKHVFSTKDVHFVLVTHLEQLANAVTITYGQAGESALRYLEKFYQLRVTLPNDDGRYRVNIREYLLAVFGVIPDDDEGSQYSRSLAVGLADFAERDDISVRTVSRIATYFGIVFAVTKKGNYRMPPIILGLAMMKVMKPDLFDAAASGELTFGDVDDFMKFDHWEEGADWDNTWIENAWRFCLDPDLNLSEHPWSAYKSDTFPYSFRDRLDIVPILAKRYFSVHGLPDPIETPDD